MNRNRTREVISGLRRCTGSPSMESCSGCSYLNCERDDGRYPEWHGCTDRLMDDALRLILDMREEIDELHIKLQGGRHG